ncbi:hypothetical protein N7474_010877 [Penicillium riverlandense]|uniref:uncharacterized protein n=1 Tax=Penicillium riverlandense TaxID=1903569 RepID=UPI00254895BF|nr:uncharacterized protein N7474_010877 [Penicillium riverlandense]KAJ5804990.1 hypothetical protein N7474_010877 [Penicillium riverlandense]
MNRFRKHKKAKEAKEVKEVKEALDGLEGVQNTAPPPALSFESLQIKTNNASSPNLDLSFALPSSDDFRTSLLMPKLSARFSMLREQDDPSSKLGKASDDSVLFPKRASRLNLFGHVPNALTDIDEVESNDGSRPSLALGRADSYMSSGTGGYGTDDDRSPGGSIMSRGRRTEGNNLFGGRQKVYKIPVRSPGPSPSPNEASARGAMGKAVYENDLNLSTFQRLRLKEKEEREAAEQAAREAAPRESDDAHSTISSTKRTTYSSTASGPATNADTSTAATSIDESHNIQPQAALNSTPEPPADTARAGKPLPLRSHRMYGQGLAQAAQNQQSSTLNRLESLNRARVGTPELPPLNRNFSKSATSLRDRLQKLAVADPGFAPLSAPPGPPCLPGPRANSPASSRSSRHRPSAETLTKERISPTAAGFGVTPPLSPPTSETEDGASLAAAVQPEDHGKATAMGLFNKPATAFDEQQFSRRQLLMYQGRSTPPLRRPSPPRRAPPPEPIGRPRGFSKSSVRSRAESASSHYSSDPNRSVDHSRASSVEASPRRPGMTTFYAASTASESGDERDDRRSYELSSATSFATEYGQSMHHSTTTASKPATPTGDHLETLPEVTYSEVGELKPIEEHEGMDTAIPSEQSYSPTTQPSGADLSGLVRAQLRRESDMYLTSSPGSSAYRLDGGMSNSSTQESLSRKSVNPPMPSHLEEDAVSPLNVRPGTSGSQAASRQCGEDSIPRDSEDSAEPRASPETTRRLNDASWQNELAFHHRRDGSTETQKEREEFALELAERRRKVQEKMRSVTEVDSRSSSPTPGQQTPESGHPRPGNAFALLNKKPSKSGFQRPDSRLKMFGYGNTSTPSLVQDDVHREEEPRSFNFSRHSNSSSPNVGERSIRSRMPVLGRSSSRDGSRDSSHSRGPSPTGGPRSRSGSDASATASRSKSRTRYRAERDDLETVEEGTVIAHENFVAPENFEPRFVPSIPSSARPSMEASEPAPLFDRASSAASGRYRSASRSGAATPSFQYEQPFQFPRPGSNSPSMIGVSPRPSPAAPPYSANATPPLNEIPSEESSRPGSAAGGSSHSLPQRAPGHNALLKRPVNKKQISEPTFLSSTSNVPTVGLPSPPETQSPTPPIPPRNPRRRGTQTIIDAFKSDKSDSRTASPFPDVDEKSTFQDEDKRPRSRNRLRKMSSEGGSMHGRARKDSRSGSAPAVPAYPPPAIPVDGGMF